VSRSCFECGRPVLDGNWSSCIACETACCNDPGCRGDCVDPVNQAAQTFGGGEPPRSVRAQSAPAAPSDALNPLDDGGPYRIETWNDHDRWAHR